ncbi:MAG: transporter ATP-binding protein [Solirubrobacterales bacterium]|nr:transporter ATP-binding protein [Solirubrobacterales bacterium]
MRARRHIEKTDPRVLPISFWWAQLSHRPAGGLGTWRRIVEPGNYNGRVRTFLRLLRFLAPYKRGVAISLLLSLVATLATVAIPAFSGNAVNAITDHDRGALTTAAILVGVAGVLRLVLTVFRRLVAGRVSLGVELDLRDAVYGHLQSLELAFFDRQQTGQLMSRATVDLQSVRFFLGYGLIFLLQSLLTITLAATAMFVREPTLALISLAPVPLVIWVAYRFGVKARPAAQEVQQRIAELTAEAEENISGVRVVKAFSREARQVERFRAQTERVFTQAMISTRLNAFYAPFIGFLPQLGLAAILFFGGRRVINGDMSLGDFTAFYAWLLMLLGPMRMLGLALGLSQRATASGARLFEVLDRAPEIASPPDARPLPHGSGRVELRDVTVHYEGAPEPSLRDVSLDVAPGTTIALVGATGSGKTTLVQLVARLYDPIAGSVLLDGADVRTLDLQQLRSVVATVDDDPFLFSATVAENIAYARPDAPMEEIVAAARRAQAAEFIDRLPDGYETKVGERGLTLSGGQRQRLAIARALLADPRVLILDDATSSVDASTESLIKDALTEAMTGRTTFIIAHRLSTIALADEIIVLEHGEIAARGTHADLMEVEGLYRDIVEKGLPDQVFLTRKAPEREAAGL